MNLTSLWFVSIHYTLKLVYKRSLIAVITFHTTSSWFVSNLYTLKLVYTQLGLCVSRIWRQMMPRLQVFHRRLTDHHCRPVMKSN